MLAGHCLLAMFYFLAFSLANSSVLDFMNLGYNCDILKQFYLLVRLSHFCDSEGSVTGTQSILLYLSCTLVSFIKSLESLSTEFFSSNELHTECPRCAILATTRYAQQVGCPEHASALTAKNVSLYAITRHCRFGTSNLLVS